MATAEEMPFQKTTCKGMPHFPATAGFEVPPLAAPFFAAPFAQQEKLAFVRQNLHPQGGREEDSNWRSATMSERSVQDQPCFFSESDLTCRSTFLLAFPSLRLAPESSQVLPES